MSRLSLFSRAYFSFSFSTPLRGRDSTAVRPAAAFPRARPENRSAGRSAGSRPDWRGTGLRAPRPGSSMSRALVSMVGTTTKVRHSGGIPPPKSPFAAGGAASHQCCQPVHQRHRQLAGAQYREKAEEQKHPFWHLRGGRLRHKALCEECRHQKNRAQIDDQRVAAGQSAQSRESGVAHLRVAFELRQSLVDQVEADMSRALVAPSFPRVGGALVRQLDRFARHLAFGQPAASSRSSPRRAGNGSRVAKSILP